MSLEIGRARVDAQPQANTAKFSQVATGSALSLLQAPKELAQRDLKTDCQQLDIPQARFHSAVLNRRQGFLLHIDLVTKSVLADLLLVADLFYASTKTRADIL